MKIQIEIEDFFLDGEDMDHIETSLNLRYSAKSFCFLPWRRSSDWTL